MWEYVPGSGLWSDGGISFSEAARIRLDLGGVRGSGWRKADSEFIFKPKWALQLPGRSRRFLRRIEIGSWLDTCQGGCRLPSGQGFRWLEARTVREGPGWGWGSGDFRAQPEHCLRSQWGPGRVARLIRMPSQHPKVVGSVPGQGTCRTQ